MIFSTLKMVKNGQNDHVTEAKISMKNHDFGGHQKYFRADTNAGMGLWVKKQCPNNFKTTSEQLWKSQILTQKYAHPPPPPNKDHEQ